MQSGHWWMTVKCLPMFITEVPNTLKNIKHTSISSLAGSRLTRTLLLFLHPAERSVHKWANSRATGKTAILVHDYFWLLLYQNTECRTRSNPLVTGFTHTPTKLVVLVFMYQECPGCKQSWILMTSEFVK
jgi:hypothetical protein